MFASPENPGTDYDQHAELMDQAWAEMIAGRLDDPETHDDALIELAKVKCESDESRTDSVTDLGNHRGFSERLELAHQYASRHWGEGMSYHVDVIDVRDLGAWNKSPDQSTGDRVLRTFGEALRAVCKRGTDYPARVGGDEFAVVRENGNPDDRFIVNLQAELDQPERHIDGKPIEIYVGDAGWDGQESAESVYKRAQGKMTRAKSTSVTPSRG